MGENRIGNRKKSTNKRKGEQNREQKRKQLIKKNLCLNNGYIKQTYCFGLS